MNPNNLSLSQLRVKSDNDLSVDFEIESELEKSFIGKIKINNSSENDVVSWQLAFAADFRINQSYDFNIITDLSDYYIIEGTDISVIPANSSIELVFNGEKNADTSSLYFDYLSEVVPSYTIDSENLSKYYNICNYSNDEFPLDMSIVIDEDTLDFDIYNSQVMGIPRWNINNLNFSIVFDINENFPEVVDYEFILCYNGSQISYKSFLPLSSIEMNTTYDYNLNAIQTAPTTEATTQSNAEAVELTEYDINKAVYHYDLKCSGLDFLSEEQQRVFWLASFVYTSFDLDLSDFFYVSGIEASEDDLIEDTIFYHTGFTYESVLNGFLSVLSENIVNDLIKEKCADINGEFVCGIGARGVNVSFMGTLDFEPIEVTDDIVKFKARAGYGDPESGTDEITSYEEVNFEMQKTDEKWIVTKFEMWC